MLASPLPYSGQLSREDYELRLAHPSGHSELRFIYLCSSLILLYSAIKFSHNTSFLILFILIVHEVEILWIFSDKFCFIFRIRNDLDPRHWHWQSDVLTTRLDLIHFQGHSHKIFCFRFFSWNSFPTAPEYPIRTYLNFFENFFHGKFCTALLV